MIRRAIEGLAPEFVARRFLPVLCFRPLPNRVRYDASYALPYRRRRAPASRAVFSVPCAESGPQPPPPLSVEALAAVSEDAGAPRDQLARQVDELFTMDGIGETRAVLLLADGKVAAERYGQGYDSETRFISWSMAKTVTAVLVGMLVADGLLSVDEPAPVSSWQRSGDRALTSLCATCCKCVLVCVTQKPAIRLTIRQRCVCCSSTGAMTWRSGQRNSRWRQSRVRRSSTSSNTTVILADIAARALTDSDDPDVRRRAVSDYLQERLFGPLGMTSIVPEFDASGTLIGGSLMHATARDYAKFGEFMRENGRAPGGEQLVPSRWIEAMTTPSPTAEFYGYQTWLNRPVADLENGHPLFPDRAPANLFSLIGHMGQYVLVSPDQRLTMVRLGHSTSTERPAMLQQAADVLALYPQR